MTLATLNGLCGNESNIYTFLISHRIYLYSTWVPTLAQNRDPVDYGYGNDKYIDVYVIHLIEMSIISSDCLDGDVDDGELRVIMFVRMQLKILIIL